MGLKLCKGDKSAVFEVPQKNAYIFNQFIDLEEKNKNEEDIYFKLEVCKELPELKEFRDRDDFQGGGPRGGRGRGF